MSGIAERTSAPSPKRSDQLRNGLIDSLLLEVAIELRLVHHVADGPRTAAELAAATGVSAPRLERVLRALTGLGVLSQVEPRRFGPGSIAEEVRELPSMPWIVDALCRLPEAVRDGRTGMMLAHGQELWEYLQAHPEEGVRFDRAMQLTNGREATAVVDAYDFAGIRRVVDVGGGNGSFLALLLDRRPHLDCVLFDQPSVVGRLTGLPFEVVGGDFFEAVPAGADAYVLSHVLHDWPREQCLQILANCRAAMADGGRVLLAEMVVPPGDEPHPAKTLDMVMLVLTGDGMERTEADYAALLDEAGFRLARVVPTGSPVSVIEAYPR